MGGRNHDRSSKPSFDTHDSVIRCPHLVKEPRSSNGNQLWVSHGNAVYAAPADGNSFNPSLVAGRVTLQARHLHGSFFPLGNVAIVIDDAGYQLVIIK
jgi:hypothetical protein